MVILEHCSVKENKNMNIQSAKYIRVQKMNERAVSEHQI